MKLKELVKIWVDTGVLTDDKFMIKGVELTTIKDDLLALEDFQGIERLYILENRGYDLLILFLVSSLRVLPVLLNVAEQELEQNFF